MTFIEMSFERKLSSVLAVIFVVVTDAILLPNTDYKKLENLRTAFVDLMSNFTPAINSVTLISDNSTGDAAEYLFSDLHASVMRFHSGNPELFPLFVKYDAIVLVLQHPHQVNASLPLYTPVWKADTKFVVVATELGLYATHEARQELFRSLWSRRIAKAVLLLMEGNLVEGHGFVPYSKNTCNDPEQRLLLKKEPDKPAWMHPQMHPDMVNLHGCDLNLTYRIVKPYTIPLKVADVQREHLNGIEGHLMETVAGKLNFSPLYRCTKLMEFAHFDRKGILGAIHFGISDIGFGLIFGFQERYNHVDVSSPHNVEECVGWVVPKGAGSTDAKWKKLLLLEFDDFVWILIMSTFLLSFCYFGVPYLGPFDTKPNRAFFLNLYPSFLGLPLPLVDDCNFRGLALAWIWYSYIITTAYRSEMSSRLTAPNPPKDIDSLKTLSLSRLLLYGPYNAQQVIRMSSETELGNTHKTLLAKFKVTDNYSEPLLLKRIAKKRDMAFIKFCNMFRYLALQDSETKGNVHIVHQCVYGYLPWVILRRASPFTAPFSKILSSLTEAGILLKWKDHYLPAVEGDIEEAIRELALDDVDAIFYILIMGLAGAFLVFIIELTPFQKLSDLKKHYRKIRQKVLKPLNAELKIDPKLSSKKFY